MDINTFHPKEKNKTKDNAIIVDHINKQFRLPHERKITVYQHLTGIFHGGSYSFEVFDALQDVSFAVKHGETFGIIGANGSGKSTLLKILAGVLYPDSGSVQVNGRIAPFLELGVGFQPDLTGKENIYLYGSIMGLSKKEIALKYEEILEFAELKRFESMKLKNYSSGMTVRLAFSTAIQTDPDILLVDEVLSVGDEAFQRKCFDKINEFKANGKTIIFVSHGLDTVGQLCERSMLLDHGHVRSIGTSGKVVDDFRADMRIKEEIQLKDQHEKIIDLQKATEVVGKESAGTVESPTIPLQKRWGSREIEITEVKLFSEQGVEKYFFKTGECLGGRIRYFAKQKIENPVFGIAIFRSDDVHINGPNTKNCDYPIKSVKGYGEMKYIINSLPILEGSYKLSVAVYDDSLTHAYDHHDRLYTFKVSHGNIKDNFGLFFIPCTWESGEWDGVIK
jgi:lipopolysaccharide transport system ATP-binding protein